MMQQILGKKPEKLNVVYVSSRGQIITRVKSSD